MTKRLEEMRNNPRGDWRIEDVEAVCREYGIQRAPARGGGSHYKVAHPPARFTACRHTANGSANAACAADITGGTGTACARSETSTSRKPPCTCGNRIALP